MLLPTITIAPATRRGWLAAQFKFHPGVIRVIKQLPIRVYKPDTKSWEFEPSQIAVEAIMGTGAPIEVAPAVLELWVQRGGKDTASKLKATDEQSFPDKLAQLAKDLALPRSAASKAEIPAGFTFHTLPHLRQSECFPYIVANPKFYLAMGTGTGKTKLMLDAARLASFKERRPVGVLLVGPNNKVPDYPTDMDKHAGQEGVHWAWADGRGGAAKWEKALAKLAEQQERWTGEFKHPQLLILGLNWEALDARTSDLPDGFFDVALFDEADSGKNPTSGQGGAMSRLAKHTKYVLEGSGTACPQGPFDLWNQVDAIRPGLLPATYIGHKRRYGIMELAEVNGRRFPQVLGYQNLEELARVFNKVSYRCVLDDCVDLPQVIAERRFVQMAPQHLKIYRSILQQGVSLIGPGVQCVAASAASVMMRARQICGGFLPHTDLDGKPLGVYTEILPNNKADYVVEQLVPEQFYSGNNRQIVVWAYLRPEIEMLIRRFKEPMKMPDGSVRHLRVASLWGDTSKRDRETLDADFRAGKFDLIVSNPPSGGIGKEFQTADVEIWYSRDFNLRHREQGEGRLRRIGQRNQVLRFDVMFECPVEIYILDSLEIKRDVQAQLTRNPKQVLRAMLGDAA